MAAAVIVPVEVPIHDVAAITMTAINATDGMYIDFSGMDHRTVIIMTNSASSAGSVVLVAGDHIQGVADVTLSVPASSTVLMTVESMAFKITDGASDYKGHVHLTGPATISVAAGELE